MITSAQIRTKLIEALELDLVGPNCKDLERAQEILIQSPSKWYLTGFIVPFGASIEIRSDSTANEEIDLQAGNVASEDSSAPEVTAARQAIFPSSMGLSFLISEQVSEVLATVSWGDYHPIEPETSEHPEDPLAEDEPLEDEQPQKKPRKTYWERTPQTVEITIPLSTTSQPKQIDVPGGSGLALVIANRPVRASQFAAGTRSVSVFLVNYRTSSADARDVRFAFQTRISLQCDRGFIPRCNLRMGRN
ncbi:MAG: hypothetical protein ACRCU2_17760, partial [Planktothrix sp.]